MLYPFLSLKLPALLGRAAMPTRGEAPRSDFCVLCRVLGLGLGFWVWG